ncbi:MAG: Flp pilus assembly protein CpaB [Bdellovibrionales bacterium]|nr:Flp pilus assembly protein CpaB [Bdellovibrionales bacterium]
MGGNETRTLWISIGVAMFAIFMLYSWSETQKSELAKKYGTTKRVVVAAADIAEMETIDESKLDVVDRPQEFIQPEAVTEPEGAVGQVAAVPIKKGEQLLQTKLLLPGPDTGLSMEVSPGKRAITLPIDDTRGVSKLLRPGDRIDIVAALDYGKGGDQRREVRTILQDVVILATGLNVMNKIPRRFELDGNGRTINRINLSASTTFTNITVEAKPEEVQQLVYILATAPGSIFTTLRHPNDRLQAPLRTTVVEDLLQKPVIMRTPAASNNTAQPMGAPATPPRAVAPPAAAPRPQQQPQRRGGFQGF